jgi:RHS repeat-associated protein
LGSPRINTDQNGQVISRHDYQPFGEEIQRASYGADMVRKQFTSYEKDKETNLDFAQARMYGSGLGRFTSPDDFLNDTHVSDPQSWNPYVYVRNNPLNLVDPLGKGAEITSTYDATTNTTNIRIRATFAIYGAAGQNVSKKELEKQKKILTAGILAAWNNQHRTVDGQNYQITTEVTVQTANSEEEAIATGANNLVEIGTQPLYGNNGERLYGNVGHRDGENFDRLRVSISGDNPDNGYEGIYAHEFGHLLNAPDTDYGLLGGKYYITKNLEEDDYRAVFGRGSASVDPDPRDEINVRQETDPNKFLYKSSRPLSNLTRETGSRILGSKISNYEVRAVNAPQNSTWTQTVKK